MKQLLFLLLFPAFAVAQYPGNANQKITLGEQTTADGLVYRGVAADTTRKPSVDTMAYILLDTNTNIIWQYKKATSNAWLKVNITPADTSSFNYVNTYGTQTVNGAKTFTNELTATRFNPTGTSATGNGMYLPASNTLGFSTNGTNKLTLNASGNLGLGVTPSAWGSSPKPIQMADGSIWGLSSLTGYVSVGGNYYYDGNYRYIKTSNATDYYQYDGTHAWRNAVSGTAGNIISFITRMTLDASGNVGIGTTSPTATLHLKAGTSSANTAPLKFTSGTNLTTAEAGAMEFNGTNLFFSPSTTRHTVNHGLTGSATIDFADTSANSYSDQTITVTGASDGDVVSLGIPNAAMSANNITYTAWVSASNTVTIRFANHTTGSVNPASGTFKVFVTK